MDTLHKELELENDGSKGEGENKVPGEPLKTHLNL